jgi:hypothetical protein
MPAKPNSLCALCHRIDSEENPVRRYRLVDAMTGEARGQSMPICQECYDAIPAAPDPTPS